MENKFNQICNTIDYSTWQKIQNSLAFGSFLAGTSSCFIEQYPMLNNSMEMVATTSSVAFFSLLLLNNKRYTEDINEIRSIYQQFIKNYNQMNKCFKLNNPIQIHTMFNYLLYEGFLSKGKSFQFSAEDARDISALQGADVIKGKGVCRHIAPMLKDILTDYGIEAFNLDCYIRPYNVNIDIPFQQELSYVELKEWVKKHILDEKTRKHLNEFIEEMEQEGVYVELSLDKEEKSLIKKIVGDYLALGNHVICFSKYNGENYYLDPTLNRIYRLNRASSRLYDEEDSDIKIKQLASIQSNSPKEYLKMRSVLSKTSSSISLEEEQELVLSTKNLCEKNRNIFEQFYNDNSEIYNEISNRLVKMKKKKY